MGLWDALKAGAAATSKAQDTVAKAQGQTTVSPGQTGQGYGIGSQYGPSGDTASSNNTSTSPSGGIARNEGTQGWELPQQPATPAPSTPPPTVNTPGPYRDPPDQSTGGDPAAPSPDQSTGPDWTGAYKYYDPNWTGGGSGGGSGGGTSPDTETLLGETVYDLETGKPKPYELPELPGPNPERLEHIDTETLKNMLQQIVDLQKEQSQKTIDYSVERGTNELNRAMEDAAVQYQTQRNQVAADEAMALDNQALYAEARGDRGGIGEAQYASIQNTAAQNRRAVNDAQVKLGTDTARQIADLRAQGEFEKADQLLSIAQSHLSQLMGLEQWALQTNLGVDEFNSQLQRWVDEYNMSAKQFLTDLELSAAQLTGMFADGTRTQAAQNALIETLANSGNALIQAGVMPSRQQLEAMGMTEAQARAYLKKMGHNV